MRLTRRFTMRTNCVIIWAPNTDRKCHLLSNIRFRIYFLFLSNFVLVIQIDFLDLDCYYHFSNSGIKKINFVSFVLSEPKQYQNKIKINNFEFRSIVNEHMPMQKKKRKLSDPPIACFLNSVGRLMSVTIVWFR